MAENYEINFPTFFIERTRDIRINTDSTPRYIPKNCLSMPHMCVINKYDVLAPISDVFSYGPFYNRKNYYLQSAVVRKSHTITIQPHTTETPISTFQFPTFDIFCPSIDDFNSLCVECCYNEGGLLLGVFHFKEDGHLDTKDCNSLVMELCKDEIDTWLRHTRVNLDGLNLINFNKLERVVLKHEQFDEQKKIEIITLGMNVCKLSSLNSINNIITTSGCNFRSDTCKYKK